MGHLTARGGLIRKQTTRFIVPSGSFGRKSQAGHGILLQKNTNRTRKINGKLINFVAKFDMDETSTDLALQLEDYDPSPSAEYESWLNGCSSRRCAWLSSRD